MSHSLYLHRIARLNRPLHYCRFATKQEIPPKHVLLSTDDPYEFSVKLLEAYFPRFFCVERFLYKSEVELMARLKSEWSFVNIKLQNDDKEKFEKFCEGYKYNLIDVVNAIGSRLYKISLSYVDKQNSWCVSVSGNDNTAKNNGCTMTSWSDDPAEAIFMALYKIEVITDDGIWKEFEVQSTNWG